MESATIPRYSNYIRINHQRKSFSFHNNNNKNINNNDNFYDDQDFLNKFVTSSNILNKNNKSFQRAVTAISKIEHRNIYGEVKEEEKPEKYHLDISDLTPLTKEIPVKNENFDHPQELFKYGKNENFIYEMNKFNFLYFFIRIKLREIPLKINIKRLNEVSRDSRLKWFISTKAKFPNRFNCDNEFEGNRLYFSRHNLKKFQEENFYFSLFSEESVKIQFIVAFGRPKSQENFDSKNYKNENFMKATMAEPLRKKAAFSHCDTARRFDEMRKDAIKAEIKTIMIKRRKKILALAHDQNKVIQNMNILKREDIITSREQKKSESKEHRNQVLEKKKSLETQKNDYIFLMANRGQLRKQRKLAFQDVSFHIEKFSMLQKEWRTVIIFIQLAMKIKNIIKGIKRNRLNQAFYRLVRQRTLMKFVKNIRKYAKTPQQRLLLDFSFSLKWNCSSIYEASNKKSEDIIGSFFSNIKENLFINNKVLSYLSRITNIQKKWRILALKKHSYVDMIKKIWNENLIDCYFEILTEKGRIDKFKSLKPENTGKKIKSNLPEGLAFLRINDPFYQEYLIDLYMNNNAYVWREKMAEFRKNQIEISKDSEKKKKVNVLQRFLARKTIKIDGFHVQDVMFEAPILYKVPSHDEIKEMIKKYLEKKKILL